MRVDRLVATAAIGDVLFGITGIRPLHLRPYTLGALGGDGGGVVGWTVILLIRKKCSVYGAMAWGLTVFIGLFLLDTAVGIRYLGDHEARCRA